MNDILGTPSFLDYVVWFVFDNSDGGRPAGFAPDSLWDTLSFSVVAAIAFVSVVVIDFSVYMVRKYGFKALGAGELGIAHGYGTILVIVFGAVGALIVGFAAGILQLLEANAQAAIVTGITWQVVYAKLLARVGGQASAISTVQEDIESPGPEDEMDIEQPETHEESEE